MGAVGRAGRMTGKPICKTGISGAGNFEERF